MNTCKRLLFLTLVAMITILNARAADGDSQRWRVLLNGKDLTGWQAPEEKLFWKVENGILIGENDSLLRGSILNTKDEFKDFTLELEARWTGEIDSGIMLRKPMLQMQMGVSRSLKRDLTCSFYTGGTERYPEAGQAKNWEQYFKAGDWNTYRLQAKGNTFTVWLNGQKVTEYTNDRFDGAAPIGLQVHQGLKMRVEFRNIKVSPEAGQ